MARIYSDGTKTLTYEEAIIKMKEIEPNYEMAVKKDRHSARFHLLNKTELKKGIGLSSFITFGLLNKMEFQKEIELSDFITLLIGVNGPIYGNLRLQKEVFIAIEERLTKDLHVEDVRFVPYRIGPYSFKLASIVDGLLVGGYVTYSGKKGSNKQAYRLTNKGQKLYSMLAKNNPKLVKILSKLRKDMDEFSVSGILRYIYNNPKYEKYLLKSEYREKYKDINWGKGRG